MKPLFLAAVTAACLPFPVAAQTQQQPFVVTGHQEAMARWRTIVSRRLDDNLRVPTFIADRMWSPGIAQVVFWAGDNGRPAGTTLVRRSGSPVLDAIAVSAVKRLRHLPPLPAGIDSSRRFRADIVFAQSDDDYRRAMKQLAPDDTLRRMANRAPADELALNVGVIPDRR
jgi:TonB family protein